MGPPRNKQLRAYLVYGKNDFYPAIYVFDFNICAARYQGFKTRLWQSFSSMRVKWIRNFEKVGWYADKDKLKANIPHVVLERDLTAKRMVFDFVHGHNDGKEPKGILNES